MALVSLSSLRFPDQVSVDILSDLLLTILSTNDISFSIDQGNPVCSASRKFVFNRLIVFTHGHEIDSR